MLSKSAILTLFSAATLTACVTTEPTPTDLSPATNAEIASMARNAFVYNQGREPDSLHVIDNKQVPLFGGKPFWVSCVSTTEKEAYPVYNNSGSIIRKVGDPYTQKWVLHYRTYDGATWAPSLFRRVSAGTIGAMKLAEICP